MCIIYSAIMNEIGEHLKHAGIVFLSVVFPY